MIRPKAVKHFLSDQRRMAREQLLAGIWGLVISGLLGAAIFVGSGNLQHVDAALVGYTFASLFAAFGVAYRYSMWLQRPPTRMYWRRGWQAFLRPDRLPQTLLDFGRRLIRVFALNEFIRRRSSSRWLTHLLIMWGCILAAAITFPLVFGWVYFQTVPGDLSRYQTFLFGYPVFQFAHESLLGHLIFHGLVWSSLLVIVGVVLALRRRLGDRGAAALQDFSEDLLPLFILFAVSVTGLLLTVSYTWLKGYAYEFLAITHAVTVIFMLLWLPFGKFFHIFQRPAQLGVKFYRDVGRAGEQAICVRCRQPFATLLHVEDLIEVERALGYAYEIPVAAGDGPASAAALPPGAKGGPAAGGHYQWVCPACRRKLFGLAQGRALCP
jgi:hypothetical protein